MAKLSLDKKKKRWRVNYLDARGKRCRRFFQMKSNAQDFLRIVGDREERVKNRLGWIEPISFKEAVNLYETEYLRLKSITHCKRTKNRLLFLSDFFESKPLCDVTLHDINHIIRSRLDQGLSNKAINEDRSAIGGLFKWAVKRSFAIENPVEEVDSLPKAPRKVRRAYTVEEIQRLLMFACSCCLPALTVLANTGIRLGELDYLTKDDFDLERQVLFITHSEATPVKGKKSRIVPLNDTLLALIEKLPEGKILTLPRSTFEKHMRRIRERAGVKDAMPHGLRHSFVSHLVESGLDLGKVQRITGHENIKTLQKYLHSTGSDLNSYRNLVQFSVPSGCPEGTFTRTKSDKTAPSGHSEILENQILKDYQGFNKMEAGGIAPPSEMI